MKRLVEILGWYGAFALLLGYALVSFSVLRADGMWYQLLSISGAGGIVAVSWTKKAYQPLVLNSVFIAIGVIALVRLILR
jgi:hypothetical protein